VVGRVAVPGTDVSGGDVVVRRVGAVADEPLLQAAGSTRDKATSAPPTTRRGRGGRGVTAASWGM